MWPVARSSQVGIRLPDCPQAATHIRGRRGACALAAAVAADSADESPICQARWRAAVTVSIGPDHASTVGPSAEMRKISKGVDGVRRIREFARTGAKLHVLGNSDSSLCPSASGIRRWRLFCDLTPRQHFPLPRMPCFRGSASRQVEPLPSP